jgi:NAD(P)-dependent dehydrogenase (short-subunit alcohol dehydrogenase family)
MPNRLEGKVAVITGACSGIGLATLELFVAEGAQVLAADLQADVGQALEVQHAGKVKFVPCDVTKTAEIKAAIDAAVAQFAGLDILFNNAGRGGTTAGVEDFDADGWDQTHALLLRAVAAGTSYAVPHLKKRGGGSVINTSSISALQAGYAPIAYSVAKAGVLHYTRLAAKDLSQHKIRINAVVPGFIATSIFGQGMGMNAEEARQFAQQVAAKSGSEPGGPLGPAARHRRGRAVLRVRRVQLCHRHVADGGRRPDHRPAPCVGPGFARPHANRAGHQP